MAAVIKVIGKDGIERPLTVFSPGDLKAIIIENCGVEVWDCLSGQMWGVPGIEDELLNSEEHNPYIGELNEVRKHINLIHERLRELKGYNADHKRWNKNKILELINAAYGLTIEI